MNYQERVSTRADVRALYERVTADPTIARYRGYTESNSYGWDAVKGDYVKKDGEAWFENQSYDPTYTPAREIGGEESELLDEQSSACDVCAVEEDTKEFAWEEEIAELEGRLSEAEERAKAAENERDEAKEALIEIRRALLLVAELAGVK